jgi:2-oxoglutarate ferredoxin oxidoreductase subunit alpha
MARLFRKISQNMAEIQHGEFYRTDDADIVVVAYGSVARSARRAVIDAREQGVRAGLLKLNTIWPFMRHAVEQVLQHARVLVVPEMNIGQVSREVKRVNEGRARVLGVNKMDGTMITPGEILKTVMEAS